MATFDWFNKMKIERSNRKTKMADDGVNLFVCRVCSRKFRSNRGLETHIGRSHSEKAMKSEGGSMFCKYCRLCVNGNSVKTHKCAGLMAAAAEELN